MKPGCPTERLLKATLREDQAGVSEAKPRLGLGADVGENATNHPQDVSAVRRAPSAAGYESESGGPAGRVDRDLLGNIRLFKRDFNLDEGNRIQTNGTANAMLARVSQPTSNASGSFSRPSQTQRGRSGIQLAGAHVRLGVLPEEIAAAKKRTAERKAVILKGRSLTFKVRKNPNTIPIGPYFERPSESLVGQHDSLIVEKAKKHSVDPDLFRAIMYLETAGGWYDAYLEPYELNRTLRPMNIHAAYWKGLGFSGEGLKHSRNNIEAGVRLLKSIQERVSDPTVEVIASVYNELGVGIVTNYGASVAKFYREKPWLK